MSVGRPIVAVEGAGRIGRAAYPRRRPTYPPAAGCVRAPSAPGRRRDTGRDGGSRERGVRRTRTRARAARARPRRDAGGQRRDRARRRGGGHRQDPARVRAGGTRPRRRVRGPRSGARSTWSARSCRTSRSSRPCARSGSFPQVDGQAAGSQLRVFEETLALLAERAAAAPVLLVLEDLHWADTSTLDLVVFLAHNLGDRRVLLLATYRADEPSSAERVRRLADGVRRSGSALRARARAARARGAGGAARGPRRRSAAGGADGRDRRPLRGQPLLRRGAPRRRRRPGAASCRVACATCCCSAWPGSTGRRRACCGWPRPPGATSATRCSAPWRRCRSATCASRCARRSSTASWSPSRRPAASASATRCWRRRSTRRSCPASARSCTRGSPRSSRAARPRRRRSSRRTGRRRVAATEALVASVEAARQAEAVFGLAEALAHLERALALWDAVPDAAELVRARPRRALLLGGRAGQPDGRGAARGRARAASDRAGRRQRPAARRAPARAPRPLPARERPRRRCPRRVRARGRARAGAAALRRSARRRSRRSRQALMLAWRYDESLRDLRAGARARPRGRRARGRGPGAHGARQRPRLPRPRRRGPRAALAGPAARRGERRSLAVLDRAYVSLTDVLTMLGRPAESARLGAGGARGAAPVRDRQHRARRQLDRGPARDRRVGRGRPRSARPRSAPSPPTTPTCSSCSAPTSSSAAATSTPRGRTSKPRVATLREDRGLGDLRRLRRRARAVGAPLDRRRRGRARRPGAGALPSRRPSSASGSAPRGCAPRRSWRRSPAPAATPTPSATWLARARKLIATARRAAAEAAAVTPNAAGWLALAEAEHAARPRRRAARAVVRRRGRPGSGSSARRWRPTAAGARPRRSSPPARPAPRRACRSGRRTPSRPGSEQRRWCGSSSCSPSARGSTSRRRTPGRPTGSRAWRRLLGLTPREAEVLTLVARGYTNREIAATLVISVRTASVHVSHILRKLGAPNRLEAAAIAHRLSPPY